MTDFTIEAFVGKLAELAIAMHEAEHAALERAARVVEAEATAEIAHLGGTGDLRDSIEHTVLGDEAHVGSNSEIAEYQELGTAHIPPRSFLGSALVQTTDEVVKIIGEGVVGALTGREIAGGEMPVIGD